jgi:hypothetical protein
LGGEGGQSPECLVWKNLNPAIRIDGLGWGGGWFFLGSSIEIGLTIQAKTRFVRTKSYQRSESPMPISEGWLDIAI